MVKTDNKQILKGFADRLKQIPNAPIQEIQPLKNEVILKESLVGFHVMLPEELHKNLKVYSAKEGISMKDLTINILAEKLNQENI